MAERNQQFDTHGQWVNYANRWLTSHPNYCDEMHRSYRVTCFDAKGRLCRIGADFMRARDEDAFPVRWYWPDEIGLLFMAAEELCKVCEDEMASPGCEGFSDDEGVSTSQDKEGNLVESPITFGHIRRLRKTLNHD